MGCLVTATPLAAQDADWSGFYAGLFASDHHSTARFSGMGLTTPDFDVDGGGFGALAGYNWQRGRVVYGAEIDISTLNSEGAFVPAPCVVGPPDCVATSDHMVSVRARVGYSHGNGLYFASLGVAQVSGSAALFSAKDVQRNALIFDFGGEWALHGNWSMRNDASFADFATEPLDVLSGTDLNIGLNDISELRLGVIRRF